MSDFELTFDQQEALFNIKTWYDGDKPFHTLAGYAGTGKTTLLDFVVKELPKESLLITATTNKAVKVLKEKIDHTDFSTIHSALNIKAYKKGTKEVFQPDKYANKQPPIEDKDLVIIDEASMISRELLQWIKDFKDKDTKILFVGDPAQLQPINEDVSPVFTDFPNSTLTSIVRYDDTIAHIAKMFRESTKDIDVSRIPMTAGTFELNRFVDKDIFKGFSDNPDNARMLCWTNKQVDKWNKLLRGYDIGTAAARFEPGDILMANEPCVGPGNKYNKPILLANSEECRIIKVTPYSQFGYTELRAERLEDKVKVNLRVINKEYEPKLAAKLKELANKKHWTKFWEMKESFHNVKHCYALTVHKSQGSTYNNVFLDVRNIYKNRDNLNRNQLMYVGITRASEKVTLYKR